MCDYQGVCTAVFVHSMELVYSDDGDELVLFTLRLHRCRDLICNQNKVLLVGKLAFRANIPIG